MSKLFGTDGVRGVANTELSCTLAYNLGRAGAYVLSKGGIKPKILIGKDSRISGDMLESALIAGMCSVGATACRAGIISTPGIAYLTKEGGFSAGAMISASHNPMEYNGIKFFDKNGFKLPDEIQDEIEDIILNNKPLPSVTGADVGTVCDYADSNEKYINFLVSTTENSLKNKKIVLDCANGASYFVAPKVFERLGAEVIPLACNPNGTNINDNCGSTHPQSLQKKVVEEKADAGFAYDGDADRLIAVDENGNIVDGDKTICICANSLKKKNKLKNNTAVVTVMSNMGLFKAMEKMGIDTVSTKVGDRYVLEEMLKSGYSIGGEQSGHIIFLDHATTGDGVLSSVQLASIMVEEDKPLSQLADIMEIWPQVLINAKVTPGKQKTYTEYPEIMEKINALEGKYANKGRLLIRPSGTEPLIRVMIEGKDIDEITADAKTMAEFIESVIK
ncbi:MAG: phosphoglucosamine mutase [Clostridia bacterium]|nr:phosphoglucosamine mutase [Clostridia bacterium]